MLDRLAIIRKVIEEHHKIRSDVKALGQVANDLEAMSSLQKAYSGWVLSPNEALMEKQKQLQQAMGILYDGLHRHFGFEEQNLPPILGEVLMHALLIDHRQIRKELDETKSVLADLKLEGSKQEDLLSQKSHMRQMMDNVHQSIEEHASREEILLRMAEKALAEEQKPA